MWDYDDDIEIDDWEPVEVEEREFYNLYLGNTKIVHGIERMRDAESERKLQAKRRLVDESEISIVPATY